MSVAGSAGWNAGAARLRRCHARGDADRVGRRGPLARRLADLGVRCPKEREAEFLQEIRELFYRYYGASLNEIDPLQVIREVFGVIYSLNLRLPTRFIILDKAIATLASVGVVVDEEEAWARVAGSSATLA